MLIEFDGKKPRVGKNVFIAPGAVIIGDVEIGDHTSIWFSCVVRGDLGPISIGQGCSIQDNVTLHVFGQTILGDEVTVGHNCVVEGCVVGSGTVIGMNSTILPQVEIGEKVMIAAGTVVPQRMIVPDRVMIAGVPATIKKTLSGEALAWTERAPRHYRALQARYRSQGIGGIDEN